MSFDISELLDEAQQTTGLSDWGESHGWGLDTFQPALEIQVATIRSNPDLGEEAREKVRRKLIRLLGNRLRLVDDRKHYAAMSQIKIERPLIVLGIARTGSTLIHGLLAADPTSLVPEYWECERPASPPPGIASPDDPRIAETQAELDAMLKANPDVGTQHPYYYTQGVHVQAECGHLLEHTFASVFNWAYFGSSDDYLNLLFDPAYSAVCMDFHRKFLQHLQFGRDADRRWVLKAPEHLKHLGALIAEYPDACIVWTHRKLLQVLPSNASVTCIVRAVNNRVDKKQTAQESVRFLKRWVDEGLAVRKHIGAGQLYDMHYADLMRDPIGTVRDIYRYFDLPITPQHEENMWAYLADNPHNQFGAHRYSLEELGLTEAGLYETFNEYRQTVGLE